MALGSAVVETVRKHAAGRKVSLVTLTVGRLRQVVPDSLSFYFEIIARDTEVEGARLDLQIVPARLQCSGCNNEWEPDFPTFRCPACSGGKVVVLSGEEFMVDSIEVEEDESCTAPK